jgi:hypothetical protein
MRLLDYDRLREGLLNNSEPEDRCFLLRCYRKPDVQYLAGHAEPRTTGLYDQRQKKVTRNIVERISI